MTRYFNNRLNIFFVSAVLALVFITTSAMARSAPESFADLAEKLLPAVVNISTSATVKKSGKTPELPQFPPGSQFEEFFRDFFDRNRPQQQRKSTSLGSGFIIDKKGIITYSKI